MRVRVAVMVIACLVPVTSPRRGTVIGVTPGG
jgi:hypothetical protein